MNALVRRGLLAISDGNVRVYRLELHLNHYAWRPAPVRMAVGNKNVGFISERVSLARPIRLIAPYLAGVGELIAVLDVQGRVPHAKPLLQLWDQLTHPFALFHKATAVFYGLVQFSDAKPGSPTFDPRAITAPC